MKLPPLPKLPDFSAWPKQRLIALGISAAALAVAIPTAVAVGNAPRPAATPETAATAETATAETATPETAGPSLADITATLSEDDATLLATSADAGRTYLDGTLFIGDSNTARYMMYADDTGTPFTSLKNDIGVVSMGAQSIASLKCEQFSGYNGMYTIPDAVAMLKPQRIIIGFGTNNLAGSSTDATRFIGNYLPGLQAIEKAWPYADIIVNAIPPLDAQRENTNLTMVQVDAYNAAILQMCVDNGYYFLNSTEVLKDESTGWAKKDYTLSDGVHLSKTAVTALFDYIRTHALLTEDRRPQPIGTVPTPVGPPVNLINKDPIAVRGQAAKVPVEFVATNGGTLTGSTSQLVAKGGKSSAVTAVPKEGFVFSYWSVSTGATGNSASISVSVPSDANANGVIVTAYFKASEHEHDYVKIEGTETPATCTTPGLAKYKCSICGDIIEKETPALGHKWDGGVTTKAAAVGVAGEKTYTCTVCGKTKTEEIPALEGAKPTATVAPTLAPTEPPAHVHSFTQEVRRTPSTCTTQGSVVYACSCGQEQTQKLPLAAHNFVNGVCTVCGAADPNYQTPDSNAGNNGGNTGGGTGGSTGGETGGGTGGDTGGGTGGETGGGAGGDTGGSTGGNTGGSTGGETGGSTGGETGGSTGGDTGGSTGGETGGSAGGETGGSTGGETGGSTGGDTGGSTGGDATQPAAESVTPDVVSIETPPTE